MTFDLSRRERHYPLGRRLCVSAGADRAAVDFSTCHGDFTVEPIGMSLPSHEAWRSSGARLVRPVFMGRELRVVDLDQTVIDEATKLRAIHGFKSPDAIHLATAITHGATVFLTGDVKLARCTKILVNIL